MFAGEAATPITLRVANQKDVPIYLDNQCSQGGPESVRVDEQAVLDPWFSFNCDDVLANTCIALDCFGGGVIEVAPGSTYEATWSGHLLGERLPLPEDCRGDCMPSLPECSRRLAAAPGTHTLTVYYSGGPSQRFEQVEVDFTVPVDVVTAMIGP
jgi:hypothetical protein